MNDNIVKTIQDLKDTLYSSISTVSATNTQIRNSIDRLSGNILHTLQITNIILSIIAITFIVYVILQFKKTKR